MEIKIGTKFGEWEILQRADKKRRAYLCRCSCGKEKIVDYQQLRRGESTKCRSCSISIIRKKHGDYQKRLYYIWCTLKQRYKREAYKNISLCDEWRSYINFREWSLQNGYTDDLTIDRIDGTKGYYPENCRWVSKQVQAENTKLLSKHNTSGYRGVSWNTTSKKWSATISIQKKKVFLGYFVTKEEAAIAYDSFVLNNNLIYRPLNILKRT